MGMIPRKKSAITMVAEKPSIKRGPLIAIDGTTSSGKDLLGAKIATRFELMCINSGLLYKGLALKAEDRKIPLTDLDAVLGVAMQTRFEFMRDFDGNTIFYMDGEPVEDEIRSRDLGHSASLLAPNPRLRILFNAFQHALIAEQKALVIVGVDIGTTVIPEAPVKFFVDAPLEVRAKRKLQIIKRGVPSHALLSKELKLIKERDQRNFSRGIAPLRVSADAHRIDNGMPNRAAALLQMTSIVQKWYSDEEDLPAASSL